MYKVRQNITPVEKRKLRIRSKINVTTDRPRLTVFRSNKYLYLQIIDEKGKVLVVSNELMLNKAPSTSSGTIKGTKTEKAALIAEDLLKKLKKQKVKKLVFDRGSYKYQGRVAVVADTLRKAGINI